MRFDGQIGSLNIPGWMYTVVRRLPVVSGVLRALGINGPPVYIPTLSCGARVIDPVSAKTQLPVLSAIRKLEEVMP